MDKTNAKQLIAETFTNDFEEVRFARFVKEVFNDFTFAEKNVHIWNEYNDYIENCRLMGNYVDNSKNTIDVLTVKLKKNSSRDRARTMQRNFVAKYLGNSDKDAALVAFFGDDEDWRFSFVKLEYQRIKNEEGKVRIEKALTPVKRYSYLVGRNEPNHTCESRFIELILNEQENPSLDEIECAFSVDNVTKEFFEQYAGNSDSIFFKVRNTITDQKISKKEAHEFTLQLLNRIMFTYFVAKKKWLNNDPRFMHWLWNCYLTERNNGLVPADSFYDKWLRTIFFEAFNNKFTTHPDLPDVVNRIFYTVPYLNGGLFKEEDFDKFPVRVKDDLLKEVFDFFERYNFTIKEDLPLDIEVAVDPQMIGYVYESLANVAEEIYDRNDLGIFYTPRVEVDFMCRRSIVEYLNNHLPEVPKELWYRLVFDENTELIEKQLCELNAWYDLEEKLGGISIIDPACGSGAFLVGMLNVLTVLHKIVNRNLNRVNPDFEIKKRIVGKSLYGVDVMPWAVHAAELRLWLQLVVESTLEIKDLKTYPLLPNLNMNLRVGDSLVQEIGGTTLHLRDPKLPMTIRTKLLDLKQEKENYINNTPTAKFRKKEEIQKEENRVFQEIIEERLSAIRDEISSIRNKIKLIEGQKTLSGERAKLDEESRKRIERLQEKIEGYNKEEYGLNNVKANLVNHEKKPFVWEIDFAEIFGEKAGFDIVIGNPPYVRQELISPPNKLKEEVDLEDKREYKEKLLLSVTAHLPVLKNINKKSDYYIYFYFHGLALLNHKGTFCFVTSNSWLDVDYGKELQEVLLKYVPIIAIYDNQSKRSFEHADINTIIVFLKAPFKTPEMQNSFGGLLPEREVWPALSNLARFIMLKKPFDETINSENLIAFENANKIMSNDIYRIYVMRQDELLKDGWEFPEDCISIEPASFKQGRYAGNKWGGKYLRAPDIFFTILSRNKEKLVKLGQIAKVNRGITTGFNDFFIINDEAQTCLQIEKRFLKPILITSKDHRNVIISSKDLKNCVFLCEDSKKSLKNTKALEYIYTGEKRKVKIDRGTKKGKTIVGIHNLETLKNRQEWWKLGLKKPCQINCNYLVNDLMRSYYSEEGIFANDNFQQIHYKGKTGALGAILNSTIFALFTNIQGRANFGGGLMKIQTYELRNILVPDPASLDKSLLTEIENEFRELGLREFKTIFEECGISIQQPIRDQEPKPKIDRKRLDDLIFNSLELTERERKEVYWSVCELVHNRLKKAESLKGKK